MEALQPISALNSQLNDAGAASDERENILGRADPEEVAHWLKNIERRRAFLAEHQA